jgi:hypothetical protein
MRIKIVGAAVLLLMGSLNAQQTSQDAKAAHDCLSLKKEASRLSSEEALKMVTRKVLPPAREISPEARITWTVLVNQDGVVQCYLDNTPAETPGRLNLLLDSGQALQSWTFKPYVLNGKKRPFITKLTFFNNGKDVVVE